jgi:integrase
VRVRRGPDRDGRWYWRADRPDGRGGRVDVWLGWGTKEEAADAVRAKLSEAPAPDAGPEIDRVGDLLDCWLASVQATIREGTRTRLAIEGAVKRLVEHGPADHPARSLGREGLALYAFAAEAAGYSSGTIARDLKYLRQAWRWAQELDPPQVPLRRLPSFRVKVTPTTTRYTPSAREVAQLLVGVSPPVRRGLILLAATGCRIGEIDSLTWDRVALDGATLDVDGKTGPRRVIVPGPVAAEIRRWERGTGRVVGVSQNRVRLALARRSEELGIGRCSPNSLRRHVVDALYESAGADPKAAGAQLGHSEQTAITHYRQVSEDRKREVVEGSALGVVLAFPSTRKLEEVG